MSDQLPPHNEQTERALLACVFDKPRIVLPELMSQVVPEMFYDERNRRIYEACCELMTNQRVPDPVVVYTRLMKENPDDDFGGMDYLNTVQDTLVSSHAWPTHLEELQALFASRRMIQHCQEYIDRAYSENEPDLMDKFECDSLALRKTLMTGRDMTDVEAVQKQLLDDYEEALKNKGISGVKTGYPDLDRYLGGMKPQELIVIAGTPSSGKTSLVLGIAQHCVLNQDVKVGIISLETSAKKVLHRTNCSLSKVNGANLLNGRTVEAEMTKLAGSWSQILKFGRSVQLCDRGGLSAPQAASIFRRMHQKGARVFILDYLQLLNSGKNCKSRIEEMTIVSTMLKGIAKELECPLLVISSLNRESTKDNRAPRLSDLRETGQIEYDADSVWLLHVQDQDNDIRTVEVHIAKNKEGQTGKCTLTFLPQFMRFESAASEVEV